MKEVEAWKFGPVIPSIYYEFKRFGKNNIEGKSYYFSLDGLDNEEDIETETPIVEAMGKETEVIKILEVIYNLYTGTSGTKLIELTHRHGTPWSLSYDPHHSRTVIPRELIKKYYRLFLEL